jgi:hypothetical protein
MALFQNNLAARRIHQNRAVHGAQYFLVTVTRFHQSLTFTGFKQPVNHVTRVRVQILHPENVFTTLTGN